MRGSLLGALRAVLRTAAAAVLDARSVEAAAQDVVADAGQVAHAAAAGEHGRGLLEVVALARDVDRRLLAVAEPHARDLAQRGVRLLRRHRLHLQAHAALLRAAVEDRRLALVLDLLAALADQLVDRGHGSGRFRSSGRESGAQTIGTAAPIATGHD